jgi:predicted CopG family antitoxin
MVYHSIPVSTTIKIKGKTRTKLENLKLHTKETYNDVIERLMRTQDDEIDAQTIKNLRKSLDDIEKGRTHSLEQVEKELGL